jgi:hypothetical protein
MKRLLLFILLSSLVSFSQAQLVVKTKCPDFYVDVLDGKVSGLKANAFDYDIKKAFPCFTSSEPDNSTTKCGGGVFYKDRDIYFYTDRDYIQIGEKFKGKLSIPLIGSKRGSLFTKLGNPKMKDDDWDAYEMQYGILILHYNKLGKVNLIQISTKGIDNISLCE